MSLSKEDFVSKCKAAGIDPAEFLKKAGEGLSMDSKPGEKDQHVADMGHASETPTVHGSTPLPTTDATKDKENAPPDPNRIPKETKASLTDEAKTLTKALFTLKQAGLLRPELLKIAADALEILPDYDSINSDDGVIAAELKENDPGVAQQLKTASYHMTLDKIVEKMADAYLVEEELD